MRHGRSAVGHGRRRCRLSRGGLGGPRGGCGAGRHRPAPAPPRRRDPADPDRAGSVAAKGAGAALAVALLVAGAPAGLSRRRPAAPSSEAGRRDRGGRPHRPAAQPRPVDQRLLRRRRLVRAGRAAAGTLARRSARPALGAVVLQLRDGWTADAGGGIWWRRGDDFKNAPANGPAAILLARGGNVGLAASIVDWMHDTLRDPATGLIRDGVRVDRTVASAPSRATPTPTARACTSERAWRSPRWTTPRSVSAGRTAPRAAGRGGDARRRLGRCHPRLRRRRRRRAVQRHPRSLPGRCRAAPARAHPSRPGSSSRAPQRPGGAGRNWRTVRCSPRTGDARLDIPIPAGRRRTCRCSCRVDGAGGRRRGQRAA